LKGGKGVLSDEELCREIQNGSESALEALIHRYHHPLYGFIYRQTHHSSLADDLVQETFIRLCTKAHLYRYPEPFRPWLYRIALNLCRDHWKSSAYNHSRKALELNENITVPLGVEGIYDRQETRGIVIAALRSLDEIYRDVLILRFYQELKIDEIAAVLEIPAGTVKWRIFHGLKLMRNKLEKGGEKFVWEEYND